MDQFPAYAPETPPPAPGPRPFSEIPSLWLKVLNMDEAFFAAELPRASGNNVALAIVIVSVIAAVPTMLTVLLSAGQDIASSAATVCGGLIGGLIGGFVGFYVSAGILYLSARIFGGTGEFGGQTYLQSLYMVPMSVVSLLLGLLSVVGAFTSLTMITSVLVLIVSLAVAIYGLILTVRVLKVAHRLTTGRAVGALFAPLLLLLVPICIIAALMLLGPALGNIFSSIIDTIEAT